jgi:hypothetical protein
MFAHVGFDLVERHVQLHVQLCELGSMLFPIGIGKLLPRWHRESISRKENWTDEKAAKCFGTMFFRECLAFLRAAEPPAFIPKMLTRLSGVLCVVERNDWLTPKSDISCGISLFSQTCMAWRLCDRGIHKPPMGAWCLGFWKERMSVRTRRARN